MIRTATRLASVRIARAAAFGLVLAAALLASPAGHAATAEPAATATCAAQAGHDDTATTCPRQAVQPASAPAKAIIGLGWG